MDTVSFCFSDGTSYNFPKKFGTFVKENNQDILTIRLEDNVPFGVCLCLILNNKNDESKPRYYSVCKTSEKDSLALYFSSSLELACKLSNLTLEELNDFDRINGICFIIKIGIKTFKIILTYKPGLSLIKEKSETEFVGSTYILLEKENFKLSNRVILTEELVNYKPLIIEVRYGTETQELRPHVHCCKQGEECNISIDDKIEYLGSKPKRYAKEFINYLNDHPEKVQKARELWNKGNYLYKFDFKEGRFIPKGK
ncbi:MAG: hypothetical protein MJ232_00295 [archaeon]|nr:hypothetical protein [Bacilli bacterium]MCQ2976442.1 hypothetical protein [archaeon]